VRVHVQHTSCICGWLIAPRPGVGVRGVAGMAQPFAADLLGLALSMAAFRRRSMLAVTPDRGVGTSPQMHARSQHTVLMSSIKGGVVFAGIDTHKDSLAVAVIDQVGLCVARADEPNTRSGFVRIGELLATHHVTRVGIEGSGHYGRCVAAYLALDWDQPEVGVFEVPTLMTSRERGARPGKGKTDPVDAVAIARITMRDPDLPPVRLAVGDAADLRALLDYRGDLVTERGDLANRVHMDLHGLFPGYHHQIPT
jgi:hypothetical protein